jgi:membrane fusion protein (multidrug efflux system)
MRYAHPSTLSLTRIAAATVVTFAALALTACGSKDAAPAAGGPGAKMPPPEVGVIVTKFEPVALQTELPARVEPVRVAQVRARVNGVVLKRLFQEGSEVKAGQTLFQIDPAPYQAALNSARANVGKSEANLNQAAALAARYKPLVEANAISKQEYVNVVATQKQAEADVAAQKAALQIAQINSGYANVQAPIAGRIGRALVTEGALVSATEATQLALIQQTSTVYLNITQSATDLQRLRRDAGSKARGDGGLPVTVLMDDGSELPRKGKLLFSDVTVDPTSGQVTLRAEVPNQDGLLLPGQYVRVRLSQASLPAAIVVPQQAVTRGTQGDTVIVVADGKPAPRPIKIGSQQGSNWIVLDGLKPGEQVVVDGFQKMMVPGAPVKPVPWTPPAAAPGAAPAATAAAPAASATGPAPATASASR